MSDSRTVRARVDAVLAGAVDAAMKREERTESDIVRRALKSYLAEPDDYSGVRFDRDTIGAKPFRGPDPRKK